jgi:hypothetical protein
MSTPHTLVSILSERKITETLQAVVDKLDNENLESSLSQRLLKSKGAKDRCAKLFQESVVARLPRPNAITAEDLAEAFIHQVLLKPSDSFEERYKAFKLVAVADLVSERCSTPFLCLTYECSERFDLREVDKSMLWESSGDFILSFNGILLASRPYDLDSESEDEGIPHSVYFTLVGHCTELLSNVVDEFWC